MNLLTRDAFREAVLKRDNNQCVLCLSADNLSVHHILERKLWVDGGYYESNGVTLCPEHHILAEACFIMPEDLWTTIGIDINSVLYPEDLDLDNNYDKWGQEVLYVGESDFIVVPNRFNKEFLKAIKMAGGFSREVNPEWLKQYYAIDFDKNALHIGKLRKWNIGG